MPYGLFNDESADWTEAEAVEGDFFTVQEAQQAIAERYSEEDGLIIHEIEEGEQDDEGD